jgi:hypothetical protein
MCHASILEAPTPLQQVQLEIHRMGMAKLGERDGVYKGRGGE